jgi:hypothetical protein
MPRLTTFLVCEKVILDKQDVPTLVAVIGGIKFQVNPAVPGVPSPLPPDAIAPQPWAIFTVWHCDPEDVGKTFRQKSELVMPDQSIFGPMKADLPFVGKANQNNNVVNIVGFPVGVIGIWNVKLWLESADGQVIVPESYLPVRVEQGVIAPQAT